MAPPRGVRFGTVLRLTVLTILGACCAAVIVAGRPDSRAAPAADDPDPADTCAAVLRRIVAKDRLAAQVLDGRLSLLGAAARFRDLDGQPPLLNLKVVRDANLDRSDGESHCREVIRFARAILEHRPGADPAAVDRLEAELRALLDRGDVRLPGPGDARPRGG